MENASQQSQNRRRRSGNRNNSSRRNQGQRNRGQSHGGGSGSQGQSRNRNGQGRRPAPQPTLWQKILGLLSFGALGGAKQAPRKPSSTKSTTRSSSPGNQAPAEKSAPAAASSRGSRRERNEVTSGRLYVGNLDYNTQESDLEELFRGAGNVLSAEVVTNSKTQQSKGFAFVEMGSINEAKRAVELLDDKEYMGRKLIISGARSDGPRENKEEAGVEA